MVKIHAVQYKAEFGKNNMKGSLIVYSDFRKTRDPLSWVS